MASMVGYNLGLSLPRRLMTDLLYFSRRMPTVCTERHMNLAPLLAARKQAQPRPGWCALFTKGFALLASRHPEFRRSYMGFPWPRLHQHPVNVATVALERLYRGEPGVFFAHLRSPERWPLAAIEAYLHRCKEEPLQSIGSFRRHLRVSRLPLPVRRFTWWLGLNVSGRQRARNFGTFGISVTAGQGAAALSVLSPLTATLSYGFLDADGGLDVRLTLDHRVLDGGVVARGLVELERILQSEMVEELHSVRGAVAA